MTKMKAVATVIYLFVAAEHIANQSVLIPTAVEMQITQEAAFVQQQHHCSCQRELQCYSHTHAHTYTH